MAGRKHWTFEHRLPEAQFGSLLNTQLQVVENKNLLSMSTSYLMGKLLMTTRNYSHLKREPKPKHQPLC